MQISAFITLFSLGTGTNAWAQAGNGEWIANYKIYDVTNSGFAKATMEACTYRNTETRVPIGQPCKYWLDGNGRIASGVCREDQYMYYCA
ncbi:hypothetical protein DER46DRAFT_665299 [Fusarium sp. MPI-SDFR-AT-0072]|nr:hypothetical protein DER46DRAFT_665299 [Fusarium sp. MPI-SDFR-AT-0072]